MANIVEFLVKIRDLATGPMRGFANATDGAMNRVSNRINRTGTSIDGLNAKIEALTKTRSMSLDTRQITQAGRELDKLEAKRDRLDNLGRKSSGGMLGTGLVLGGLALAGAGLMTSMKAGMERQMAGTSFEVMAGKKTGDNLHKNLIGFASDTIYGNEVFGEAKTMLGFGIAAKNVMPSLKMLGDIAMGNKEHMQALTLAFSQTTAAGRLMGQDMLQYVNAGFNPLQAISQKTGRSMADLKKDMEKGKISVNDVAGAIEYATGPMGRFHNGMQRMGETPAGKWVAFTGMLETAAGTIGVKLLPVLGGVVDVFNWFGNNTGAMYGVAAAVGAMTTAWALYTAWTQRAAIWQGILAVIAFWPIAAIGAVVGLAVWAAKSFDGWGKSINGLWGVAKAFTVSVGIGFKDFFQTIIYWGELFYLKIKGVFQYVGGAISNVVAAMKMAMSGDFSGAKKALTMEIKTSASDEIAKLQTGRDQQKRDNVAALDASRKAAAKAWGEVGLTKSKEKPKTAADWLTSKFDPKAGAGGNTPAGVQDTAKGIAGGGVRNVTINIAKQGIDNVTINAASVPEGKNDVQRIFIDMFNQIVNSGGAMLPNE